MPLLPPYLQFKAKDFEDWAERISARSRFAVLLRTLVHSTGSQILSADFPGNDDSERPGWDGFIEAGEATAWLPLGKSGWEFGVDKKVKRKADGDYKKSVEHLPPEERAEITFVFVTLRRWRAKEKWRRQRQAERQWKDVRVYDAKDLEEWLEQSIPAQAWFADERGVPARGVRSLDACWEQWKADCNPPLAEGLFDEPLAKTGTLITEKLTGPTPQSILIKADSRDEALAFLHSLFAADHPELAALRDRVVVFDEPEAFAKLIARSTNFIPVVTSPAVEQELAPYKANLRAILVSPRNAANAEADVMLEPLSDMAFENALRQMGCHRDDIDRWSRESGRCLTVLRRRLSGLEAISRPKWASDKGHAASLVPFLFAGAWDASNADDKVVLSLLAAETPYDTLERRLASLLQLEDSPVWSIGSLRGLISKIDTLFAINRSIIEPDLERFYTVAELLVLAEDDPSLDLPAEKRWMAALYGKTRKISDALRDGICETLVLLAVYGARFFNQRLGLDPEQEAGRLIRKLLSPLTARTLEAHSGDLPMYAEAAPEVFLEILEADLASPDPETLKLMRPVSSALFESCPRAGLLWALENTAWRPEYLVRTAAILARLAETPIADNVINKPSGTLSAIFRSWVPQTAATLEERVKALEYLVRHYPKVAWPLCVEQFSDQSGIGHYSYKPRWRPDAHGHGEPISVGEARAFALRALELALDWKAHTCETLADLIASAANLDEAHETKIWDLVADWSKTASDEDKTWLREKLRISTPMRQRQRNEQSDQRAARAADRARRAYEQLEPKDLILKHTWLFKAHWIDRSADEIADENPDFEEREKRIAATQVDALRAIVAERGMEGVLALAEIGNGARLIGSLLPRVLVTADEQIQAIETLLGYRPLPEAQTRKRLICGLFGSLPDDHLTQVLPTLTRQRSLAEIVPLLVLAPFRSATWRFVESLGRDVEREYWNEVQPIWRPPSEDELRFAVNQLLDAGRPVAAFNLAELDLEQLEGEQLYRLMKAMATSTSERASPQLKPEWIRRGIKLLNESGQIAVEEMALLEFRYLKVLERLFRKGG